MGSRLDPIGNLLPEQSRMMMVLSPASKIQRWSFGRYATRADRGDLEGGDPRLHLDASRK